MAIRKRGNSWQVDIRLPNGKRHRKSLKTKEEAELYVKYYQPPEPKDPEALTMSDLVGITWATYWRDNRTGDEARRISTTILKDMDWLDKPVADLRMTDLVFMRNYYRDVAGNSVATTNRKLSHINKMLHTAVELELVPKAPHLKQSNESGGRERILLAEEEQELLNTLEHHGHHKARHLVIFLLDTGCRVGEALELTKGDVSRKLNPHARVGHFKDKNGRKAIRQIPLTRRAAHSALQWGDLRGRNFRKQWKRAALAMGIEHKEFIPHMLRHTCASRLASKGMELRDIMEWMGHRSYDITLRYAKFQPSRLMHLRDALEKPEDGPEDD